MRRNVLPVRPNDPFAIRWLYLNKTKILLISKLSKPGSLYVRGNVKGPSLACGIGEEKGFIFLRNHRSKLKDFIEIVVVHAMPPALPKGINPIRFLSA